MKEKVFKRIVTFLLVSTMIFSTTVSAFAAETNVPKDKVVVAEYTLIADDSGNFSARQNNMVGSVINSNGTATYYPNLDSYIGVSKTFVASTSSSSTSGAVFLTLSRNGKTVSNDWIMGVNDSASWSVTLPSSGTYTLRVVLSGTNNSVSFAGRWA